MKLGVHALVWVGGWSPTEARQHDHVRELLLRGGLPRPHACTVHLARDVDDGMALATAARRFVTDQLAATQA